MTDSAAIAATLLQGLIGAISSVWQYYLSVILGLVAVIAALAQSKSSRLALSSKIAITVAVVLFGVENYYSLSALTDQINGLVDIIKAKTPELAAVSGLSKQGLILQPIGLFSVLVWLWLFDRHPKKP
jgi:hypothetical protein